MNVEEAIRSRRACKKFDPDFRLEAEEKKTLLQLALLAPTAFNLQHVRFVDITDPDLRQQLREVAWNQPQVTDAAMLVVLCGKIDSWDQNAKDIWQSLEEPIRQQVLTSIDSYYRDKPKVQRDEVMRSCGLVAQTLMLAAQGRGLDSCPMDGFDFDAVARLIGLPDNHVIGLMVAVGKRAAEPFARIGKLSLEEAVIENRFA